MVAISHMFLAQAKTADIHMPIFGSSHRRNRREMAQSPQSCHLLPLIAKVWGSRFGAGQHTEQIPRIIRVGQQIERVKEPGACDAIPHEAQG